MLAALRLTRINLYKHLATVNFWTPFILAVAAVYEFTHSLADMAAHYSVPINGFAVSFLFTTLSQTLIIFLGIFILFSDLPFKDNQQMFMISRTGKRAWIFSQVFYVLIVSLMYFAFIFICFCIVNLPNLGFSADNWGKLIKTLAATNAGDTFGVRISVSQGVLTDFPPLEAFLYSFGTAYAVAVVLGLVILFLNLTVKRQSGIIVSGMLVFMLMFTSARSKQVLYYFSPINWCSIRIMDKNGVSSYPDTLWIITVLCIWFALEIIALFIFGSKKVKFVMDTKEEIT